MVFQGEVLPIGAVLLAAGDAPETCWRFGILQTLDDYASTLRRGGVGLAAEVFADEPAPTGSVQLDAAFAALADHLAERDAEQAEVDAAWDEEIDRRVDGILSGKVELVDGEETQRMARAMLAARRHRI